MLLTHSNEAHGRYGNNFANIGSVRDSPPGNYLLRPAGARPAGLTMCDGPDTPGYKGIIDFATIYGSLEIRLLLRNNGTDLKTVHKYQHETKTKTIPRNGSPLAPALTESLLQKGALTNAAYSPAGFFTSGNATNILDLLAKVAPYNPPQNRALTGEIDAMLARAGISNGTYEAKPYNLTAVNDIVLYNSSKSTNPIKGGWKNFGHGWFQEHRNSSGDFHTDYSMQPTSSKRIAQSFRSRPAKNECSYASQHCLHRLPRVGLQAVPLP